MAKASHSLCSALQSKGGLSLSEAKALSMNVDLIMKQSSLNISQKWSEVSKSFLEPEMSFEIHECLFDYVYSRGLPTDPRYIWVPNSDDIPKTNIHRFIMKHKLKDVSNLIEWASSNREDFWRAVTDQLDLVFQQRPESLTCIGGSDLKSPIYYPDCRMNGCDSILRKDRPRDSTAIIWAQEGCLDSKTGMPKLHRITHAQLESAVARIAYALIHRLKCQPGTAIGIDMPMNWQSVAVYLGILRAGCVVVSIADSFATEAISIRMRIANARVCFTQDFIVRGSKKIPLYSRVRDTGLIDTCIVVSCDIHDSDHIGVELRPTQIIPEESDPLFDTIKAAGQSSGGIIGDLSFNDFLKDVEELSDSVQRDSMDVANILFSSGTTGTPKAIPWHHSTFIKPLSDGWFHQDIREGETVMWPTNVGWMMGPWLICQLGLGATLGLFVGSPVSRDFCKFVEISQTSFLGVIPSMVKVWKRDDTCADCDWSLIRRFSSTGEASNPRVYHWLCSRTNRRDAGYAPVLEYVGGTEIAGGYLSGTMMQPQLLSSFSCPCLGLNIAVLDDEGRPIPPAKDPSQVNEGELFVVCPSLGLSTTLLNADHQVVYFDGVPPYPAAKKMDDSALVSDETMELFLRRHGDQIRVLNNGYFQHLGRVDDTMNLGGIKVSSVDLEHACVLHPWLSRECAAISYRASTVGQDNLVVVAVPDTERFTCFELTFTSECLGLKISPPTIRSVNRTLISGIITGDFDSALDTSISADQKKALVNCAIYSVNGTVVWSFPFSKTVSVLKSCSRPTKIVFVHRDFDCERVLIELRNLVRSKINPLFKISDFRVTAQLPRTASGKVKRRVLRKVYADSVNAKPV